jgi:hypothetical protein
MKKWIWTFLFFAALLPLACTSNFPTVPNFNGQPTITPTPTPTFPPGTNTPTAVPGTPLPTPTPGGNYQLQWGSFGMAVSQFYILNNGLPSITPPSPNGIAVGGSDVFVQDGVTFGSYWGVKVFDFNGNYIDQWAFPVSVAISGVTYQLGNNYSLAADSSNNLYALDTIVLGSPYNMALIKFNSAGVTLQAAGVFDSTQVYGNLTAMAVGASGNVFLCGYQIPVTATDLSSVYFVDKLDSSFNPVTTWGSYGSGAGQLLYPVGIGVDSSDNVYVVDSSPVRVEKFTSNGTYLGNVGVVGSGYGQLMTPEWIALDGSNNLYLYDTQGAVIGASQFKKFNASGTFVTQFGTYGTGPGQFLGAGGMAVDSGGDLFMIDSPDYRVEKFHP